MFQASSKHAARNGEVLRIVAQALAPYLCELFQLRTPEFYDQTNSPLGRRKHLDLVRSGTLPGQKVGRRVRVAREAIDRYMAEHGRLQHRSTRVDDLAEWGVTMRGER